jgi:flavoprotein
MCEISKEKEVYVAFTRAGEEVARTYGLLEKIKGFSRGVYTEAEQGASSPVSASRRFDVAVVAPASANTIAKIACGIADTLATNIVAQSLKVGRTVIVLPTDQVKDIETTIPSGKKIKLTARNVDLENVEKIKKQGIIVVKTPGEIKKYLK